jgi:hypothetical protein
LSSRSPRSAPSAGICARTVNTVFRRKVSIPFDHGVIRILLYDPADAKSALKYSESISFQVAAFGFSLQHRTADVILVQSFVLALQIWYVLRPLQRLSCIELAGDFMSFQILGRAVVIPGSTGATKYFVGRVRRYCPMILFLRCAQSNLAHILLVAYRVEIEVQRSSIYPRMDIVNHSFATCPYWPYSG